MWTQLSANDLWNALSAAEITFFNQNGLMDSQSDRVTKIVVWVASLVRGKIAAYPENEVFLPRTDPTSIPPELYLDAIQIARYTLLTAFPAGRVFLDEPRMQGYRDAMKHLDDVAIGKLIVQGDTGGLNPSSVVFYGSRDQCLDFGFWH